MNKYVVRQPIKDKENNTFAYEIMYALDKMNLYNQMEDVQAADTISDFLMQNTHIVEDNKLIFITFTPNLLFKNVPKIFEKDNLIIQIDDNVVIHPLSNNLIGKYKKEGYKIAANNFEFNSKYLSLLDNIDYIKIDIKSVSRESLENLIKLAKGFNKKCIVMGVTSKEEYDYIISTDIDYFQGTYISDVVKIQTRKTEFMQGNFFQLIVEVTKDEPDIEVIESIISRDAGLSYGLLKVVNSPFFALKNRATTINQAITLLGLVQLKRWVYLLSFSDDSNDDESSEEILKTSFLRASFSSELVKHIKNFSINKSEAYLLGMFSTLNYLIDAPLSELLDGIYVSDEIKEALLEYKGEVGTLYKLVLSYEKADWKKLKEYADELNIPKNVISQIYFDCVEEVNNIWNSTFKTRKEEE